MNEENNRRQSGVTGTSPVHMDIWCWKLEPHPGGRKSKSLWVFQAEMQTGWLWDFIISLVL